MKLLKNHSNLLTMENLWKPARLLFKFPESPRPESESFKETPSLNFEGFTGEATIGKIAKYLEDKNKQPVLMDSIDEAVADIVIQSEVAIKNRAKAESDPVRSEELKQKAKEIKSNRPKYRATLTRRILSVSSSLVHNGDTIKMDGSNVTITHKEKDGKERPYPIDVSKPPEEIVPKALRETNIRRTRQSLEMLKAERTRDDKLTAVPSRPPKFFRKLDPKIQQGLEYMRTFQSGSVQQIMEGLEMAPTAGYDFRAKYWKEKMGRTDDYAADRKQNAEMTQHLKKAAYKELGLTESGLKDALKAEFALDFNTLKGKLEEKYGVQGTDLPASREELLQDHSIENSLDFIAQSGLAQTDIENELTALRDTKLDEALEGVINFKLSDLNQKFSDYHNYKDPIEADAQHLQDNIDALITQAALKQGLTDRLNDLIDIHRLRIAGEYVKAAEGAISALPDDVIQNEAFFTGLPEVEDAKNAISAVDNRKATEKTNLENQVLDAIDGKMVKIAENQLTEAKKEIDAVTNWEKRVADYQTFSAVVDTYAAISGLRATGRNSSDSLRLETNLNTAIDTKRRENIENYMSNAAFEAVLTTAVTDKTKDVAYYQTTVADIKAVSDAILTLTDRSTLMADLVAMIQNKINSLP